MDLASGDPLAYLVLAGVGLAAGVINTIAGGGSFLTLPALIFLGLPATTANGTNRVGLLAQNVAAVWGFRRHGVLPRGWLMPAALPACAGAVLGTGLALVVGDEGFRRILAVLMVVVTLWSLIDPVSRWRKRTGGRARGFPEDAPIPTGKGLLGYGLAFFGVGVYGGFVQAGAGFFLLAITTAFGLDLVRGNALKAAVILIFTVLALGIFTWQGHVEWLPGLAMGVGNLLGGLLGVRLTVRKGHRWVQGFVTLTVILFALELWWGS